MIELSTIRDLVAIFGVIAGFSYYVLTVRANQRNQRHQLETRRAQLFTSLYSEFRRPENLRLYGKALNMNWSDYDEFQTKYSALEHMEERIPYSWWSMYFQEIGVLVQEGFIDINIVAQFLPDAFRALWEKFKPIILEHRERENYPQYFAGMEYLYNEFSKIRGHQLNK